MKRRGYAEEYLLWVLVFDLLAVAGGLLAAYLLRFELRILPSADGWSTLLSTHKGWDPEDYLRIWPVAVLSWGAGLALCHAYRPGAPVFDLDVVGRLISGSVVAMAIVLSWNFFFRVAEYSRIMPLIAVGTTIVFLILERWLFTRLSRVIARRQLDRVLILGSGPAALRLARAIASQPHHAMSVVGFITDDIEEVGQAVSGLDDVRFVGHADDIRSALRDAKAQQLIVAHPDISSSRVAELMLECERAIVECRIVPDLLGSIVSENSVRNVGGILLFGMRQSPLRGWNVALKRVFDIVASAALLVALSPFLLVVGLLVKLGSRGPMFYKQQRTGLDGRRFNIYKFRSMRVDAEAASGPVWTREDDDRRTGLGEWMRRRNVDELPQLFNVFRGDMSLVGPRPERPHFIKKFRDEIPHYMRRHYAKCGITGWAQVNGLRGDSSIEERIAYDLYYIDNWSLWFDIKILLMTFGAIKNAY